MDIPDVVIRTRGLSKQTVTQKVCDELHSIARACSGHLTPEDVINNARDAESPIHEYFEWDDGQAAERFRYIQAAVLIRSVRVQVEIHPQDKPQMVRAFVSVTRQIQSNGDDSEKEEVKSYVPLEVALKTENYRNQMLENAFSELRSFQRKYSILQELATVFKEIEKLSIPV